MLVEVAADATKLGRFIVCADAAGNLFTGDVRAAICLGAFIPLRINVAYHPRRGSTDAHDR